MSGYENNSKVKISGNGDSWSLPFFGLRHQGSSAVNSVHVNSLIWHVYSAFSLERTLRGDVFSEFLCGASVTYLHSEENGRLGKICKAMSYKEDSGELGGSSGGETGLYDLMGKD